MSTNANNIGRPAIWLTVIALPLVTFAVLAWSGALADSRSLSLIVACGSGLAGLILGIAGFRAEGSRLRLGIFAFAAGMLGMSVLRFLYGPAAPSNAVLGATLLTLVGAVTCFLHFRTLKAQGKPGM